MTLSKRLLRCRFASSAPARVGKHPSGIHGSVAIPYILMKTGSQSGFIHHSSHHSALRLLIVFLFFGIVVFLFAFISLFFIISFLLFALIAFTKLDELGVLPSK
jgi:hypothetical protein